MTVVLAHLKDWKVSVDQEKIAWVTVDREGESANSLGRRPLEELGAIVEFAEKGAADKSLAGLVIMSGKEKGYIVGANYGIDKNAWLGIKWMTSSLIDSMAPKTVNSPAASTRLSVDLLQVDLNARF